METELSGSYILLLIFGAAALLLWGTRTARTGVTRAFGAEMRHVLSSGLRNPLVACACGLFTAGILQSSTAVALFLASFARVGTIEVGSGLAVMLGADVGSAVVASLLTLNIKAFWPLFIAVGYTIHAINDGRSAKGKHIGRVLLGIGLILLALNSMAVVSQALSSISVIQMLLVSMGNEPLIAILLLALLTWLAHSSVAIVLLVASLVGADVITDPALIVAMVLGINLGGGLPAIVMTWAEPPEARRITIGNGLFRLLGAFGGFLFLPQVAELYQVLPGDPAFGTVTVHILFNAVLAVVFLGLIRPAAALLENMLPTRHKPAEGFGPLHVVSPVGADPPSLALSSLIRETLRVIDIVDEMLTQSLDMLKSGDRARRDSIRQLDDHVDTLYEAIKSYATDLTREDIEVSESRRAVDIISFATNLENAGDIIEKSLTDTIGKKIKSSASFSDEGSEEIWRLFQYVEETMRISAGVTLRWDRDSAQLLLQRKRDFKRMVTESSSSHLDRLRHGEPRSIETSSFHLDLIGDLQRVNSLLSGISYAVLRGETTGSTKFHRRDESVEATGGA